MVLQLPFIDAQQLPGLPVYRLSSVVASFMVWSWLCGNFHLTRSRPPPRNLRKIGYVIKFDYLRFAGSICKRAETVQGEQSRSF